MIILDRMKKVISLIFSGMLIAQIPQAQPAAPSEIQILGKPRIRHYDRGDFHGDTQFWTACEDSLGVLYFGNNDGTLIFDGTRWQNITFPNNSSARSLHFAQNGTVYMGGFGQFGAVSKDAFGNYQFESLLDLLRQEDQNIENVWDICEYQGTVIFRTYNKLLALKNNQIRVIPTEYAYYSNVVNGQLLIADADGLKVLELSSINFSTLVTQEELDGSEISSILPGRNDHEMLITTKKGTLFSFSGHKLTRMFSLVGGQSKYQLITGIKSKNEIYYFGTLNDQIISLDKNLNLLESGKDYWALQDNTVLKLFETRKGNVWALLNNGLDLLNTSSASTILFEEASVFDVEINRNTLYMATNQGVFKSTVSENRKPLNMTHLLEGQAWSLQSFEGKVLCGHDRGLFEISETGITRIGNITGVWKIIKIAQQQNKYLVCTYDGLILMEYSDSEGFVLNQKIAGFNESGRDILQAEGEGVFWVCHGYKGIYRLKLDKSFTRVLALEHFREKGLPSPFNINVFKWQGKTVFTTNHGIFQFNESEDLFEPFTPLNQAFGQEKNVRKIIEAGNKTWFVLDDMLGYFEGDGSGGLQLDPFLELKGSFNRGLECIYPMHQSVLIGTTEGLFAYDLNALKQTENQTVLTKVTFRVGAEIKEATLNAAEPISLPNNVSDITFEYAVPGMSDPETVQFRYRLSQAWSAWDAQPVKQYEQLNPGKYTFEVGSRSLLGETGTIAKYAFRIMPVWYKTNWAYLAYACMGGLVLLSLRKLVKAKISREKTLTQQEEQEKRNLLELELERIKLASEKEKIELEKQMLEQDVVDKSKELTNYTMLLAKKRELITNIKEALKDLKESARTEANRMSIREIVRSINMHLNDEEYLKVFETNFERVHKDFFDELKANFPDLSPKELRLCALVRMNLTNKDIAPILNISIRGVETARYRLRKRLSIDHDENMASFLDKLADANQEG